MWTTGDQTWCCPFCQKQTIKVFYRPTHGEMRTSRGSGVSNSFSVKKKAELIILSETCSNCGKTKKEIEPELGY